MNSQWIVLYCVVAICITIYFVFVKKANSSMKMKSNEFAFLKEMEGIKNAAVEKNYVTRIESELKLLAKKNESKVEDDKLKHSQAMELKKLNNEHELILKYLDKK
jgi:hypothetical protein